MVLSGLCLIHTTHAGSVGNALSGISIPGALYLHTCQRSLWICLEEDLSDLEMERDDLSILSGTEAYALLLRVATGLESQVVGETDIFGQLKEAWRKSLPDLDVRIDFWIQKIFEDTKEIRARYLEHLGGVSYGSLVRKFLKDRVSKEPTLLIGAGQLAQSVGPFLVEKEVWIWNRSMEKSFALAQELRDRFNARVRVLETAQDEAEGWRLAAQAIVCVPLDDERDARRIEAWETNHPEGEVRTLLHLGAQKAQSGIWKGVDGAFFLDDLFAVQKAQGEVRSLQLGSASRACEERAKLRSLGTSVNIHHGWEDLAVFA